MLISLGCTMNIIIAIPTKWSPGANQEVHTTPKRPRRSLVQDRSPKRRYTHQAMGSTEFRASLKTILIQGVRSINHRSLLGVTLCDTTTATWHMKYYLEI